MIGISFTQLKVRTVVDVFTYLTGVLCIVAVSGHIAFSYPLVLLAAMGLSAYLEFRKIFIPRWLLTVLSVAVILYFFLRIDVQDLIGQIMEALFVLMGIKFLERKEVRDFMQIYALALFVLAGLGLMTLGMAFVAYLLVFFILLSLSLIFLTFYSQDPGLELTNSTVRTMIARCLWIPLLAIPLSAVMFVVLPRTSYPILTFLNRPDKARVGFTDNVRLGQVSDIQEDERIIFRATMERIDESSLYWRGITLDHFDGTSWKGTRKGPYIPTKTRGPVGRMISQTIYLEPYGNSYLFALDKPVHVGLRRVRKNDDLTFTMPGFIERRVRYTSLSTISNVIPEETVDLKTYLQLPANLSPLVISLAKGLAVRGDKEATAKRVLGHFSPDRFRYSLKGLPVSKNPLETFLFDSPTGNCEYFASAMAVLLRINDIPSRLVGGYRGGYYNEMGNYYLVPQKHAHVWVEAHIAGRGWVRFDPTPAGEELSSTSGMGVFLQLRMFLDTVNYYWYGIVLTYNLERQVSITRSIMSGLRKPSLSFPPFTRKALRYSSFILAGIGLMVLAWFLVTLMKQREMAVLDRFLKKLKGAGYEKKTSEGLEEFVSRIADDDLRTQCLEFVREFEKIYYEDRRFTADDLKRLDRLAGRIDVKVKNSDTAAAAG
ncbi:MAG: transglutaminaseTgpA domain-containing protein [Syntrophorhabdaceae bacterium]|nr:transglutaminaseTgpA domain-containing protein [Syntrophorhabdaceae bacterium]